MNERRRIAPLVAALLLTPLLALLRPAAADTPRPADVSPRLLLDARRVVVLGDSITHDGRWLAHLVAWMERQGTAAEVLDLALPSETVSGISEDGHAEGRFPRPDLAERLDRVLRITRPDLVLACYGMNCGAYQPLDEGRFGKFKAGSERLHAAVEKSGGRIVHLTPPPYDKPADAKPASDHDYDAVLAAYSDWLVSKRADGWLVIDVHAPVNRLLAERRKADAAFRFAPDGIHPDDAGHWAMFRAVAAGLGDVAMATAETPVALAAFLPEVTTRLHLLRDAYLSATGHTRPGLSAGLPLTEAEERADRITDSIRSRRLYLAGRKMPSREWVSAIEWPRPRVVDPGPAPAAPAAVPPDAVVLFDGKDLSAWNNADKWRIADGVATIGKGTIRSKQAFGDCQVHLEFRMPPPAPNAKGQARSNSGLYLMSRYEIQLLDSFEDGTDGPLTYPDGQCGAIYKQRPPAVNACRRPGEWQTYDILFTRPRFAADGTLDAPGRVSVVHNGVAIHSDTKILGSTLWDGPPNYTPHADALPFELQDHGNPIEFRSIWVRPFEPVAPRPALDR
ncbi:MAG: family 16 glycoside hydrolase [Planctomycetia bacterium]